MKTSRSIRVFQTETQYNNVKNTFEYPTVAYVRDTDTVHYMAMALREKYKKKYLTFEALESGTFTLTIPANINSTYMTSVSYSTDNGTTWVTTQVDNTLQTITTPTITAGNKVLWKGVGKQMAKGTSSNDFSYFSSTGNFNVSGNVMSLLYGDNFQNNTSFNSGSYYNFANIFENATKLTDAVKLILPATTLESSCYEYMFYGCTSLTTAPELPATTLATYCYYQMFYGCTSLTTAPELPATTLANNCYQKMFQGCTSLTTAPELPATTLANICYYQMFYGCTSLTTAPELPATTLANNCYNQMFSGCTGLTTAPELPATTLESSCYYSMFQNCTGLTTAPELPATTLARNCYSYMFQNCSSLNYIKAMFTTTPGNSYTNNWVNGVAATGTFVKNSAAQWNVTGVNGVPSGWTVQTAAS